MSLFIPLMVIVPLTCAIFLNLIHGFDKLTKLVSVIVAIALPIMPLCAAYGFHYFGGYQPIATNNLGAIIPNLTAQLAAFHPAITYAFGQGQQVLIFLLGIVGMSAVFTSIVETKKVSGVYLYLLFMLTAAMSALILTDDIFNLYVFFEIAALVQVGIVLVSRIKNNYETALKYMILGGIAGPFLLLGIAFLLGITGNVNITDIVTVLHSNLNNMLNPVIYLSCAMIIFGWLYASGLPPFNAIKSDVYSKGLPNGAMLLQSFSVVSCIAIGMVILRIFGILELSRTVILAISVIAMILGICMAMVQTDFKRVIAYLAVGELGYIGVGIGLGTIYSLTAGLFQAANELIITSFLFIGFGTILYKTKTSDIKKLGGLLPKMPFAGLLVILAGFAMSGVPPFNAFQSKFMLCQAALTQGIPELAVLMIILSIVTFLAFLKIFYMVFLRPMPDDLEIVENKVPKTTIGVMVLFLIICLAVGIAPDLIVGRLGALATHVLATTPLIPFL
ncbi:MAG: energy conserving hydrogenase EhbF [Methanobacteriaceae archaeon]|nr:energy conserving hydrogenase EhbF [Methanobacteriaceae archaeon]